MNWKPPYVRPEHHREDPGLLMRYRWSDELREIWRLHVEMGVGHLDPAVMAGWGVQILSDDDAT